MTLIPESISTIITNSLDETWAERLSLLKIEQLYIDLAHETNTDKLELWLEMFGISFEAIPDGLSTEEYQRLLQSIIIIYRLSGTKKSMQLLAYVLGAETAIVNQNFTLVYNGLADYNGQWFYDSGTIHRPFIVNLEVTGITDPQTFIDKLKKIWEVFEPVWVWLESVSFDGQTYNT